VAKNGGTDVDFINSFKVRSRLLGAFSAVLALLVLVAFMGVRNVDSTFDSLDETYNDYLVTLRELGEIARLTQRNRVLVMDMLLNPSPENVEKRDKEIASNSVTIDKNWKNYLATNHTDAEKKLIPELEAAQKAYVDEGLAPARAAFKAGDHETARKVYFSTLSPKLAKAREGRRGQQVNTLDPALAHGGGRGAGRRARTADRAQHHRSDRPGREPGPARSRRRLGRA
jgi:hypothetical protein